MKDPLTDELSRQQIQDLLFHALRAIYLFEREEIRKFGLNYQQMYILKLLKRRSPYRVSGIADELRIPAFAATRLINQMSANGHIVKSRDVKDRRNVFIRMTSYGEEELKKIEEHIVNMMIDGLKGYSAHEIRTLIALADRLDVLLMVDHDPGASLSPRHA